MTKDKRQIEKVDLLAPQIYEQSRKKLRKELVEYKKFTQHKSKTTLIGMEIPSLNGRFYPVPIKSEQKKAKKYFEQFTKNTYSIGRAGSYRYEVDIDDCIYQSLQGKAFSIMFGEA